MTRMRVEILPDAEAVAQRGVAELAAAARDAVAERGRFAFAVSGGRTPWRMLAHLADQPDVPWARTHVFQVDERVAPAGDPARNWSPLEDALLSRVPLPPAQAHAMPVDHCRGDADLTAAVRSYAAALATACGVPPVLDLIHLGLGHDGHTASLVPGDAVLDVVEADVAFTETAYQGHRRVTLTFPMLARARRVLWIVTGAEKHDALTRLRAGDPTIPAGRVRASDALLLADRAAAGG
ncbi:6-phosphogluconolactonase [Myxococcota bacterium]|nr:6-phosphogluconolactonase [Myxococcota bacterium]